MTHRERLKVLTWHVHGTYLYYLTQADVDFYLPVREDRSGGYGGKAGAYAWGDNVHEIALEDLPHQPLDVILFQSRQHYAVDQYEILTEAQRALPKVYLEHDPPREHPTDTRHVVRDPSTVLVHCTEFNRLMWDNNGVPTAVIDHGIVDPGYRYEGTLDRGIVVINNLQSRGRRLGLDVFEYVRRYIPVDLVGINATDIGGLGEIPHHELADFTAQYRFFFNPIRYTSLGLAILEAMMVGLPIVGLATTELVSVIQPGVNGYIALNPDVLIGEMKQLLDNPDLARTLGQNARVTALARFSIERFARDWEHLLTTVAAGRVPPQELDMKEFPAVSSEAAL